MSMQDVSTGKLTIGSHWRISSEFRVTNLKRELRLPVPMKVVSSTNQGMKKKTYFLFPSLITSHETHHTRTSLKHILFKHHTLSTNIFFDRPSLNLGLSNNFSYPGQGKSLYLAYSIYSVPFS